MKNIDGKGNMWLSPRDKNNIAQKKYRITKKGKLACQRKAKKYREINKLKVNARVKLEYAVKTGRIKRFPCRECGDNNSEGHHLDYNQPYMVIWLCKFHHSEEHNKQYDMVSKKARK